MEPYPTLSPDGRYLAFRAPLQSKMVVWVQALGDLEARPLSGTEEGGHLFWSPDSQSIGFMSAGRLIKVAAFGGSAPQELCTCSSVWGGTWNSDGSIVFATSSGGLVQVSSNGGQVSPVTRLDESAGEFSHRYPRFLPGGRRFVYLVRSTKAEQRGVYLGSLDDPTLKRRLVPDDANAAYGIGPDGRGYLFFVRDLALLAQPFNVERGELTGAAGVMARPVLPGQGGRLAPYTVEGRTLVYLRREQAVNRLVWVNRSGVPEATLGTAGADYSNPALSPDGRFVATGLQNPRSGKDDIWLLETRRPASDRLTTDSLGARYPVWHPDGSRVVYASAREGEWALYSRSTSGSDGEESLSGALTPGVKRPRDVTSDGRFLLFQGERDLWALPLVDKREPFLLMPEAYAARVSPDGRWLAYAIGMEGQTPGSDDLDQPFEAAQVYVTTFPKPTERWRISTSGGEDPQWSSDGKELFYIAGQTLMSVAVRAGATFDYETPQPLFRISFNPVARAFGSTYSPSLDRQRFLVNESLKEEQRLLAVTINWSLGRPE
jgi:Tol biopolymer transport system component